MKIGESNNVAAERGGQLKNYNMVAYKQYVKKKIIKKKKTSFEILDQLQRFNFCFSNFTQ